jgi:hypothetical protein
LWLSSILHIFSYKKSLLENPQNLSPVYYVAATAAGNFEKFIGDPSLNY